MLKCDVLKKCLIIAGVTMAAGYVIRLIGRHADEQEATSESMVKSDDSVQLGVLKFAGDSYPNSDLEIVDNVSFGEDTLYVLEASETSCAVLRHGDGSMEMGDRPLWGYGE